MQYDFTTPNPKDTVHPFLKDAGVTDPGILPHSVAEMRFDLAPEILRAMHQVVDVGSFGYQGPAEGYAASVTAWMRRRHNWSVQPEWMVQTSGVVVALGLAVRTLTEPGDGVIIQPPVYGPFFTAVENNGRTLIENPLRCRDGRYTMDFDDLREKAPRAKLLLLCSPHNPVGRVWTREELRELADICLEHDLYVVSDEIHFDLAFQPHTVLTQAAPELTDRCIICTAPSKTFNLAGCGLSNIIIPDPDLRKRFQTRAGVECGHYLNVFAYAAAQGAYTWCDDWLEECKQVIWQNAESVREAFARFCPQAVISPLEGTYLMWIDLRCLGAEEEVLMETLKKHQVFVNGGSFFGAQGKGYIRFNLAAPAANVCQAMERMERAIRELS